MLKMCTVRLRDQPYQAIIKQETEWALYMCEQVSTLFPRGGELIIRHFFQEATLIVIFFCYPQLYYCC